MKALIVRESTDIMEIDMGHKLSEYLFGHPYNLAATYWHILAPSNFGMRGGF